MDLDLISLSQLNETKFLARLAHELTVCARDTYEVGTENVCDPQTLRAYNELLHRVTASVTEHLLESKGFSLQTIAEMVRSFGVRRNRVREMERALGDVFQYATKNQTEK